MLHHLGEKEKYLALIKGVKLTQDFEEVREFAFY
jgi:hypothetical protein